ncbi:MAG: GNAT family N-acetyltransferase [Acidimicrobiia bacterium]
MSITVHTSGDPSAVLDAAGWFLASDPVRHNLILTLLHGRVEHPEAGRYWTVVEDHEVIGVVFQSPLSYAATMTPMSRDAVRFVVDVIADEGVELPGVNADAATSAHFAGAWSERTGVSARPTLGQRLYELATVVDQPASGVLRRARTDDLGFLVESFVAFVTEIGDPPGDSESVVARRLAAGQLWVWDDDATVSMCGLSTPIDGVVRVGPVYTPPERRGHGYASALVAGVSSDVRSAGHRCILYTDLHNPTSNSIYRRIGFQAVAEGLAYEFGSRVT